MELKTEFARDVRIGKLFERQPDIQPDILAARIGCASVGRFHNPRSPARTHHEPVRALAEGLSPRGDHRRQRSGFGVISAQWAVFADPRRAEEHDGVTNPLPPQMGQRLEVFRYDAQRARVRAGQKRLVSVSQRGPWRLVCGRDCLIVHDFDSCRRSAAFLFSSRTVRKISGSFWNAVIARSHSDASNAGDPDMRAFAGTSPPMPLCA